MDALELMKSRYSCRKFADEPVSDNDLNAVLEAGRVAPSAVNRQPWRFLVVQHEEGLKKVDQASRCRYGAPVVILVCFADEESAKNEAVVPDYGWVDCSLAIMQMVLEAESRGLGTCIVGAYDPQIARELFAIPEGITPVQFVMLGHPAMGPSTRHEERRPLSAILVRESF